MTYRMAPSVELEVTSQGSFLVMKRPLSVVRLNELLLALVRKAFSGPVKPASRAETQAFEALVKKGLVEREEENAPADGDLPSVSVIIPVKDRAEELQRCLQSLAGLDYPAGKLEVIVVDDGSSDSSPDVAQRFAARLLFSGGVGEGPAAARNIGAAEANSEILAFIDSDCTASAGWLKELTPSFSDHEVAAVGGWVDGLHSAAPLDRYEAVMSSLTLGTRERSGRGGNDTFYLPSCNLLVRRDAFLKEGGFDSELHVGEDVDLTWRLRDEGNKIVYIPQGKVFHEHRSRLAPFMKRRFQYGTSESILQTLHPERCKKMVAPPVLTVVLLLCALSAVIVSPWPAVLAGVVLVGDAWFFRSRLDRCGVVLPFTTVLEARLRAFGSFAYYTGFHLIRYYSIPLLFAALAFLPLGLFFLALTVWVGAVDYYIKQPKLSFAPFLVFYLMEHIAYGTGVFWGCFSRKTFMSYRLELHRVQTTI